MSDVEVPESDEEADAAPAASSASRPSAAAAAPADEDPARTLDVFSTLQSENRERCSLKSIQKKVEKQLATMSPAIHRLCKMNNIDAQAMAVPELSLSC